MGSDCPETGRTGASKNWMHAGDTLLKSATDPIRIDTPREWKILPQIVWSDKDDGVFKKIVLDNEGIIELTLRRLIHSEIHNQY